MSGASVSLIFFCSIAGIETFNKKLENGPSQKRYFAVKLITTIINHQMSTPFITWGCIVILFLLILLVRFVNAIKFCVKGHHRFIEFGSEREEFFLPGDPTAKEIDEYCCDDFDDL